MFFSKKISLRSLSFWGLFLLSIGPLAVISTISIKGVLNQLRSREVAYKELFLKQHLSQLETQVHVYKELMRFTSQLPAVHKIFNTTPQHDNINLEQACAQYTRVINRTFSKYPEINSVHIFSISGKEVLHITKDHNHEFQIDSKSQNSLDIDQESFVNTLNLKQLETIAHPRVTKSSVAGDLLSQHLKLQLHTPIRYKDENIGIYVSDIDMGILSKTYPQVHWVFSDGSFLSDQKTQSNGFTKFPGLAEVMASGKAGLTGESPEFSWIEVFQDSKRDISLWAGKKIQLGDTGKAKGSLFSHIAIYGIGITLIVLLIAYYISNHIQRFHVNVLNQLKEAITRQNYQPQNHPTNIKEIDTFTQQLESLIHDHKEFEKKLEKSAKEWRTTFDATNSIIWLLDKDSRIIRANKMTESLFQVPVDSIIGKHCWEITHKTDGPIPECPYCRTKCSLTREVMEIQFGDSWFEVTTDPILNVKGELEMAVHIISDITSKKEEEIEREKLIAKLQKALDEIKTLKGILPICSQCKKIRNDEGYWNDLEVYIQQYSDAYFSHGICPDCSEKLYGKEKWYSKIKDQKKE